MKFMPSPATLRSSVALLAIAGACAAPAFAQTAPGANPASPAGGTPARLQAAPAAPAAYTISPGDQLSVQVYGDQSLSQSVTVMQDGTVNYPLIGRVALAGKTPPQAANTLTEKLTSYVKHPIVTVAVAQEGQYNVLVLGNVKSPGKYTVRSGARLTDALAAAGGLGPTNGDLPNVRVTQQNGAMSDVSLQRLLHDGQSTLNIGLNNNTVVYVTGRNLFTVEVVGAVDRPGAVELNEGDRLSMAIARAGTSPNIYSDLNRVVVTRTDENGKAHPSEINMYNALKGGDMRYDPVLLKGDVVYVPQGRRPGSGGGLSPFGLIGKLIGL